jgi:hypothetical protein
MCEEPVAASDGRGASLAVWPPEVGDVTANDDSPPPEVAYVPTETQPSKVHETPDMIESGVELAFDGNGASVVLQTPPTNVSNTACESSDESL